MRQRTERIVIETEQLRLTGDLTLPAEGYRSRLTDFLNSGDVQFVALTDVVIEPFSGGEPQRREFVALSRRHIVLAAPASASA